MKPIVIIFVLLFLAGCATGDYSFTHTDPEGKVTKIVREGDCLDTQMFDHTAQICHERLGRDK